MNLLPHQEAHAQRLLAALREHGRAGDLSDPGTGKTAVAAWCAQQLGIPVIVVAPLATLPAWREMLEGFGVDDATVINYEGLRSKRGAGIYDAKSKPFPRWLLSQPHLVIFDEAHRCKGRATQNTAAMIAATVDPMRHTVLVLSATLASSPLDMRASGAVLGCHRVRDWWQWCFRHGCVRGRFGVEFRGGVRELEKINRDLETRRIISRMRIAEIADFPETLIEAVTIDIGTAARRINAAYDVAQQAIQAVRERRETDSANALTEILRARQEAELAKVPAMVEMAEDAIAEGQSVALFVGFSDTVRALNVGLLQAAKIVGDQTPEERQHVVSQFQNNKTRVVICNIAAGGVGISLHDPSGRVPRLSIISPTYSAAELRQALGRVRRHGGAGSVQRIVFAAGTIEERVARAVRAKLARIDTLNDGDLLPMEEKVTKK